MLWANFFPIFFIIWLSIWRKNWKLIIGKYFSGAGILTLNFHPSPSLDRLHPFNCYTSFLEIPAQVPLMVSSPFLRNGVGNMSSPTYLWNFIYRVKPLRAMISFPEVDVCNSGSESIWILQFFLFDFHSCFISRFFTFNFMLLMRIPHFY